MKERELEHAIQKLTEIVIKDSFKYLHGNLLDSIISFYLSWILKESLRDRQI